MRFRHKFNAIKTERDGIKFASRREAAVYEGLKTRMIAGDIKSFILQPKFLLQPKFIKNGKTVRPIIYIADFEVTKNDGSIEIIDAKGFKNQIYKLKKKLFDYKYPDKNIVEV